MFLGTSRRWWITIGVLLVLSILLLATDIGGTLGTVVGAILLLLGIGSFAAAPMRYGRDTPKATAEGAGPVAPPTPLVTIEPPPPRAQIEARDASEV